MAIATEMKKLTQDIASSKEARAMRVREIREEAVRGREEAQERIKEFRVSRKDTGTQLRKDLAQDKTRRKSETGAMLKRNKELLGDFRASRSKSALSLRKDLSKDATKRRSDVRELIKGFRDSRKSSASELKKGLSQYITKIRSDVKELLGSAQTMIKDFQKSRTETTDQLKKDLAQSRETTQTDVREMRRKFQEVQNKVKSDLKEAKSIWQKLASTGKISEEKEAPPVSEGPAEEEKAPVVEVEEEEQDIPTRLLTAIQGHPDGISLGDAAENLGVATIVLGRPVKKLVDEGKVKKEENLYFPVTSK